MFKIRSQLLFEYVFSCKQNYMLNYLPLELNVVLAHL